MLAIVKGQSSSSNKFKALLTIILVKRCALVLRIREGANADDHVGRRAFRLGPGLIVLEP